MAALHSRCGHYIFCPVSIFLLLSFPHLISAAADWMSTILLHMVWPYCKFRMKVWNVLHAARWKCRTQKIAKNSPSGHHCTTLSSYIFTTEVCIDNWKNLLKSSMSFTCSYNMVNFGSSVGKFGTPQQISVGFASWQCYCMYSSSGCQTNFAVLNRGRHLYSAGWPSRWALAHICSLSVCLFVCPHDNFRTTKRRTIKLGG